MFRTHSLQFLKRSVTDLGHSYRFPCTKRRRISSSSTGKSLSGATRTVQQPFFSPNAANEPPSLMEVAESVPSLPARSERPEFKVQSITSLSQSLKIYSQLSKSRLTFLVVLTSMAGVAMSPLPTTVPVLLGTAFGTTLCSAAANTFNQLAEVPLDAQMSRTRNRPLVRGAISVSHATGFGIVTGLAGPAILATFANPAAALLGAGNIFLYSGIYTSLKRTSVVNTWVGSIVGGIPPLMGWVACGGTLLPSSAHPIEFYLPPFLSEVSSVMVDNPLAPWALFALLFSWQFPHFNSLAHLVRDAYAQGGYKMLPVTNPRLNSLISLRHALALVGICSVLTPLSGLTTWAFALTSLVPNAYLTHGAWRFWRSGTEKHARVLWHVSLWYLPVILALMMFHKQGMDWLAFLGLKNTEDTEVERK
ncbi:hypothetical protein M422DRAFT_26753 [Sphaerobolus stellatus SS14]|nr:hypothetical protein M422DRAFT_26753 [Sphaerobolus stellatus SS14]